MSKIWLAIAVLTVLLFAGTGYVYYFWQPVKEMPETPVNPGGQTPTASILDIPITLATRDVTLFIGDPAQGRLTQKVVKIPKQPDVNQEIAQTIQTLIHPAPETRNPAIPDETELLNVFMTRAGIVYLNLNRNLQDRHLGGVTSEIATVSALVNTVLVSFKEAKQVQILVEGAEIETLAGHIDCRKPFSKILGAKNL